MRASSLASHAQSGAASDLFRPNSYDRGMSGGGLIPMYGMWRQYNARLVDKIRSLSDEQLKLRARPDYWPIWAIASHTAGTRIYWLCGVFKESGAKTTPFPDASGFGWEDDESTPRGSDEVAACSRHPPSRFR